MRLSPRLSLALTLALLPATAPAALAQADGPPAPGALPPGGYGSLRQDDLALRVRNAELEVRFVPLDARLMTLLARDSYESLQSLMLSRRRAIDSVASAAGISRPGLALVTFFGGREGARFDPQTLTILVRNREFRPLGIVPFTPRFTSQQLAVREQVSAIYLFEESLPVSDDFSLSYGGLSSESWQKKQPTLDRERARVASRVRGQQRDSLPARE